MAVPTSRPAPLQDGLDQTDRVRPRMRSILHCARAAGFASALFAAAALAVPSSAPSSAPQSHGLPVNPLLRSVYDGSSRRVLATCAGQTLNEEELLLYLLLTEDERPALYDEFLRETDPERRREDDVRLKKKITEFFYCQSASSRQPQTAQPRSEFDRLALRAMQYPVDEFVWIQNVIRPQIVIHPGDERLYYRNHPEEFVTHRRTSTRLIFRRIDPAYTEEEIGAERELMDTLRKLLKANPQVFEMTARQYSQAPSAKDGGLIPPFKDGEVFAQYERAAAALNDPGEVSDVVEGPEGLYLIQLVERELPKPVPFEEAKDLVRSSILVEQTRGRVKYETGRLRAKQPVESRAGLWDDLLDSSWVVRVADFKLTKGDFWRLYPSIISPFGALNAMELIQRAERLIEYELIEQDLKRRGLDDDPRLQRAAQLAAALMAARKAEAQWLDEHFRLSLEEAASEVQQRLASQRGAPRKRLFRIWAEVDNPRLYDATTLANLREHLPRTLQAYVDQAQRDPQAMAPAKEPNEVPQAVRGVKSCQAPHCKFSWSDMGYVDPDTLPMLSDLLRSVRAGQFSAVERSGDLAVAYFVGAEERLPPEERRQREAQSYRAFADEQKNAVLDVFRNAVSQSLAIRFIY